MLGVVLGGTTLAVGQAALIAALAPLVDLSPGLAGALVALAAGVLLAVTFTALGFVMAWRLQTTRAYHALMNVLLVPVWLLSGSFFPETGATGAIALVMRLNPATYGVAMLRYGLHGMPDAIPGSSLGFGLSLAVSVVTAAGALLFAARVARQPER